MPPTKISVLLNGGIDEQSNTELGGPIATPGASLTLRQSLNTRLSKVPGSCVRAPNAPVSDTLDSTLYGLVPSVAGRNVLAFHSPGIGSEVLTEAGAGGSALGAGALKSNVLGGQSAGAYIPTRIAAAGALPSCQSISPPASCFATSGGIVWTAFVQVDAETVTHTIHVSASFTNGALLAPATVVAAPSVTGPWVALTNHHGAGVRLWYKDGTDLKVLTLTVSGNTVSASGSATAVASMPWDVVPAICSGAVLEYGGTVDSTYADYAYIITTATTDGRIYKYNVTNNTKISADFFGVMTLPLDVAVCMGSPTGLVVLGAAFLEDGTLHSYLLDPATLAIGTYDSELEQVGTIAMQPYQTPTEGGFVVAVSRWQSFEATTAEAVTAFYTFAGTLTLFYTLPWMRLYSKGATTKLASDETYPVFDMVACYAYTDVLPSSQDYTLDPAVIVYLVAGTRNVSPVARFACARSVLSPVRVEADAVPGSSCCELTNGFSDTQVRFNWSKDVLDFQIDDTETPGNADEPMYPGRYTQVDFSPHQPPVTHDKSGIALVAAALPVQWDGEQVVEVGGPLQMPHLIVQSTPGIGAAYDIGAYKFGVYFEGHDAAGLLHRSAPAIINWDAPGGVAPMLTASAPAGLMDNIGRTAPVAVFFGGGPNWTTIHRLESRPMASGTYDIDLSDVPLPNSGRQIIYTTGIAGQQQPPALPPPCADWVVIGDRVVGIDAEVPDRLFFSKRRVSGKGFEFSPFFEVLLPSGAGRAVAVREWQGTWVVFTDTSIYQVAGAGPDNIVGNPSGGGYSPAQRVGSVGCTNLASVLVTPKGILFQRGADIMLFSGGEPVLAPGVQFENDVTATFLLPNDDEAVVISGNTAKVYNYKLARWTTWEIFDSDEITFVADLPWSTDLVLLATNDATPAVRLLDGTTLATNALMEWETDWVVLSGDFEARVNLHWLRLSARRMSEHGLVIKIYTNYDESDAAGTTTTKTYPYATITQSRYTVRATPKVSYSRGIKVRITETDLGEGTQGIRPISLTYYFSVESAAQEDAAVPALNQ